MCSSVPSTSENQILRSQFFHYHRISGSGSRLEVIINHYSQKNNLLTEMFVSAVPSIRKAFTSQRQQQLSSPLSRFRRRIGTPRANQSAGDCINDSGVSMAAGDSLLDQSGESCKEEIAPPKVSSSGDPVQTSEKHLELRIKELEEQLRQKDNIISVLQEQNKQEKIRGADLEKLSRDLKDVREQQIIEKSRELLSSKFTKNQSDLLLGVKKRVNWTSEELSRGFTLRFFGLPGYDYLTKNLGMPFPKSSCLRQYASRMDMRQGFLDEVLQMLKAKSQSMSEYEKVCVLLYDEMSVSEVYEYDRKHDDILGPHTKVQVVYSIYKIKQSINAKI